MSPGPWWHLLAQPIRHRYDVGHLEVEVLGVVHSLVGPVDRAPHVGDTAFPADPDVVLEHIGTWPWMPTDDEIAARISEQFGVPHDAFAGSSWGEHTDEERACAARHGIDL